MRFARSVLGGAVGAIVGAIASVNVVIFSGVDDGYQASPAQVFDQKPVAGVFAVLVFLVCVWGGAVVARRGNET